jgi:hypothetical protein
MKPIATQTHVNSSLLLWALAAVVAMLVLHVALGWMREAQRARNPSSGYRATPGQHPWWAVLIAASVLGTGFCTVIVLGLSSESMGFTVGYRWLWAPGLWVGSILAALPVVIWLSLRPSPLAYAGAGLLMAASAMAVQVGWILAAGFRPGVVWRYDFLSAAAVLMLVGFWATFAVANSIAALEGRQRRMWRLAADGLGGLTLIGGQEIVANSARLLGQAGSVYQRELSANILSLVIGALVPIVLAMMAMDLSMRRSVMRRSRRDVGASLSDDRNRRKRRRYRQRGV